jgi:hypothetical protein
MSGAAGDRSRIDVTTGRHEAFATNQASGGKPNSGEPTMLRKVSCLVALGALAMGAAMSPAAAGDYRYGYGHGYPYGCAAACEPYYVVNHGPMYSGPGIVVGAGYFDLNPELPVAYPYVGPQYFYRPYDGGPYADSIRRPQIMHVDGRMRRSLRAPRRLTIVK